MLVPQIGVTHDQKGQASALVVGADGKVAPRPLVTAGMRGPDWIVESGLNPGDRVIVQGTEKVRPGMAVKAVPAQLAAPASGASTATAPQPASASQPASGA